MAENSIDLSGLGSIDFTPDWAKKDAGVSVGKFREVREDAPRGERKNFDREERKNFDRGERKSFDRGEHKGFGAKKPFDRKPRFAERPKPLDVDIKILPETKALGTIIRKIQSDTHAYKLKDLAHFFLDNPESILLKVSPRKSEGGAAPVALGFYQCKVCGFASTNQAEVIDHILSVHISDYYDAKEVACEPPKGNFNCVAKCGLSGVLLGPPNLHEFGATVREMIRTKYPDMSEEQYRSHLEMLRDTDSIEAWRAGATKRTAFFAKGQADLEGAASLTREQAEGEFKRTILPSLLETPKNLMITAAVALKSPVQPFVWAVKDAIAAEQRAPYAMCFALRGALHHRKMHFFRANDARGPEFVTSVEYKEFDAEHAIAELAQAARFVMATPCCDKNEFPADVPEFEKHLNWLVSTGHVVAFTNGVYSAVEKYPKYGPQWKKRSSQAKVEKVADVKAEPVAAEPVVEPVAENVVEEKKDEVAPVVAE